LPDVLTICQKLTEWDEKSLLKSEKAQMVPQMGL